MFRADSYIPTRVIFGAGCLEELGSVELPGTKAVIFITNGGSMVKTGILGRVEKLLDRRGIAYVLFDEVSPNPTKAEVMRAVGLAKREGCDFVIGLGGGSSIDAAKAAAMMMKNGGDLWDYAAGTGGKKQAKGAAPIIAITTTAGTGTETNQYSVVTNEATNEKLDFTTKDMFPHTSIIDPELMVTLPRGLTVYQGFDALFHAAECYITNDHENKLLDLYAEESIGIVTRWLPVAADKGDDIEARAYMAYAADVLSGYCEALVFPTSHHIIAQSLGGLYPAMEHGVTLIVLTEAYYTKLKKLVPEILDALGAAMGEPAAPGDPGQSYINGLVRLMEATGVRYLKMSDYGVDPADFPRLADMVVDVVGIDYERYTLTKQDVTDILEASYR